MCPAWGEAKLVASRNSNVIVLPSGEAVVVASARTNNNALRTNIIGILLMLCRLVFPHFFGVFGLNQRLQAGQISTPEDTIRLQPSIDSFQGFRAELVITMSSLFPLLD